MSTRRIFYWCQDSNRPSGGEKHSYQHVDILSRNGFDAYVLHTTDGFRQTWFENVTPVAHWNRVSFDAESDYLVVPEILGLGISAMPGRKVIFNKNIYRGFNRMGLSREGPRVYLREDVAAIISVSPHNRDYLQFAYPDKPIVVVQASIRPQVFTLRPLSAKKLCIAYAGKAPYDGRTLYQLLMGRAARGLNRLADVEWRAIVDLNEQQVIAALQDALIFVFLSTHEGLPRLPLEAMACGCLVCAYDSGEQFAYLPPEYQFKCGDLLSMARRIERVVAAYPDDFHAFEELTRTSRRIAERYSDDAQERTVLAGWETILSRDTQHA